MTRPRSVARLLALALLFTACAEEGAPPEGVAPPPAVAPPSPPATGDAPVPTAAAPALPARRVVEAPETFRDGKPVAAGDALPETGKLEVKKGGRALITLQPESLIELRPGASVKLGTSARRKHSLELLAGAIWSLLPKGQADFEVVTANAVAGVRGTTFFAEVDKKGQTYVCACDGELELSATGGLPRNVSSTFEHKGFAIKGKGKKTKLQDLPKQKTMNHTKEQYVALDELRQKTK